jgi:hypothetical protein
MFYHQDPNPYLFLSSLLFLLPMYAARPIQELWMTRAALGGLVVASASYHATKNGTLYYIDQAAVFALFLRSIIDGWLGGGRCLTIALAVNGTCGYLYYYGRVTQGLIWSPDFFVATASHLSMHLIVAGGYVALIAQYAENLKNGAPPMDEGVAYSKTI